MTFRRVGTALVCLLALSAPAWADDEDEPPQQPPPKPTQPAKPDPSTLLDTPRVLDCDGWRYPLNETRTEIGPARFARQAELQRELLVVSGALADCRTLVATNKLDADKTASSVCYGLEKAVEHHDQIALNVFDEEHMKCLSGVARPADGCEGIRDQMTTMRRYDELTLSRAELVLSQQLCSKPGLLGSALRSSCQALNNAIKGEAGSEGGAGPFALNAPLPEIVAAAIDMIREDTDGRFAEVTENAIGAHARCHPKTEPKPAAGQCYGLKAFKPTEHKSEPAELADWNRLLERSEWGMCSELDLADCRATTCRDADVYIDERGELHLNKPLTTSEQRKNATLCIDISDFDAEHPLMVTVKLHSTPSVPERVWPGETMAIGSLLDGPVTREDVLGIQISGKARGVSLSEVLRVNGVNPVVQNGKKDYYGFIHDEACRVARGWVPVVDHEVPIGPPDHQKVIPVLYGRGRDGETRLIKEDDSLMVWVRDIDPDGSVMVEQANGTFVQFEPPPLVGQPSAQDQFHQLPAQLRGGQATLDQPIVPRRQRYPGSRTLRLGHPSGNNKYPIRVCTGPAGKITTVNGPRASCATTQVTVDENLFVHGVYHFGVRAYFGLTYFRDGEYNAVRTPRAQSIGPNVYEVTRNQLGTQDIAVLFAFYPFGRDPYLFEYRRWYHDVALLAGFTLRSTNPLDNMYLGGSLPIANGVSVTFLANLTTRNKPIGVSSGDLLEYPMGVLPNLPRDFGSTRSLDVGASIGVSFDYDLAEKAFRAIWGKIAPSTATANPATPAPTPVGEE
jgi:hypothetical protein